MTLQDVQGLNVGFKDPTSNFPFLFEISLYLSTETMILIIPIDNISIMCDTSI